MNIKKVLIEFIFLAITSLSAHEFWVDSQNNTTPSFNIGYGHDFPKLEKIPENRLDIFEALKITGDKKTLELKRSSTSTYNYELNEKLEKGSYILSGVYKPTYWTRDKDYEWYKGKAKATLERYLKSKYAYYGRSDLRGVTEILPLKAGKWLVKVEKKLKDNTKCDKEINIATLTFEIKE